MGGSPQRYVALGDSFTEGVGDWAPDRPNGVRGWADRVAEVMCAADPDVGYANLAIRGRKVDAIIDEQIDPALALDPDLITIYAGANDILRPGVDLDRIHRRYDEALGRLRSHGARVLVWTACDVGSSGIYAPLRGRFALYNEFVREIAEAHGAEIVDYWRMREYRDARLWDADRLHMGPAGHQHMAIAVLDHLGIDHDLVDLEVPDLAARSRRERLREDTTWARTSLGPWVHRRVTGRSSGDALSPRHPDLTRIE